MAESLINTKVDYLTHETVYAIINNNPSRLVDVLAAYHQQSPLLGDKTVDSYRPVIASILQRIKKQESQKTIVNSIHMYGEKIIRMYIIENQQYGSIQYRGYQFNVETFQINYGNNIIIDYTKENALEFLCFLFVSPENLSQMLSILCILNQNKYIIYFQAQNEIEQNKCVRQTNTNRPVAILFYQLMMNRKIICISETSNSNPKVSDTQNTQNITNVSSALEIYDRVKRTIHRPQNRTSRIGNNTNTREEVPELTFHDKFLQQVSKTQKLTDTIMLINSVNCGKNAMSWSQDNNNTILECIKGNLNVIDFGTNETVKNAIKTINGIKIEHKLKDEDKQTEFNRIYEIITRNMRSIAKPFKDVIFNCEKGLTDSITEIKSILEQKNKSGEEKDNEIQKLEKMINTLTDMINNLKIQFRELRTPNGNSKCGFCTPSNEVGRGGFVRERHLIF